MTDESQVGSQALDWRNINWPEGWSLREQKNGWVTIRIPPPTYPGGQFKPRATPRDGYAKRGVCA